MMMICNEDDNDDNGHVRQQHRQQHDDGDRQADDQCHDNDNNADEPSNDDEHAAAAEQEEEQQQQQPQGQEVDPRRLDHHPHDDTNDPHHDHTHTDHTHAHRPSNMMAGASFFSRLFFIWPYPLLKLGLERPLVESDLPSILPVDTSRYNKMYFQTLWSNEIERTRRKMMKKTTSSGSKDQQQQNQQHRPSLHRAILYDFFRSIWYVQPLFAAAATAKIVQAVALGRLIETFELKELNRDGWVWAGVLVICGTVILMEHHHVFFVTWRKGMQYRIACISTIYDKSLKLSSTITSTSSTSSSTTQPQQQQQASSSSSSSTSTGQILNIASNDVERFLLAALFASHLVWSPVQALAILAVGVVQVGYAFAAGFALLILGFMPFQLYLSNRFAHYRSHIATLTDRRVHLIGQAVHGARVMKMSGYERNFSQRIQHCRQQEVRQIMTANKLKAWNEATFFSANVVISLVIFIVDVVTGGILTAGKVFTVFTLINILQLELTKHMSLGVMGISEVYVSITRIQNFLEFPELPTTTTITTTATRTTSTHNTAPSNKTATETAGGGTGTEPKDGNGDDRRTIETSSTPAVVMSNVNCYWNFVKDVKTTTIKNDEDSDDDQKTDTATANDESPKNNSNNNNNNTDGDNNTRNDTDADTTLGLIPALMNINIEFCRGQLSCIIGTVGCSKSALLQAIVGELPVYSGSINIHRHDLNENELRTSGTYDNNTSTHSLTSRQPHRHGRYNLISYAAQDPWIMDGTVRENIVLGETFDQGWYDQVVNACGLRFDFDVFQNGDQTIVGDRGVQCSGGQRARIGLARALYRDADILVADDPLSAVDAKVGKQIFYEALMGLAVNRNKCVILATHQHQYVHDHRCILMSSGTIKYVGSYEDCVHAAGGTLTIHDKASGETAVDMVDVMPGEKDDSEPIVTRNDDPGLVGADIEEVKDKILEDGIDGADIVDTKDEVAEKKVAGVVQWETYVKYIEAMGGWWIAGILLLTFVLTQGVVLWTIATMGRWAERSPTEQDSWDVLGLVIGQGCMVIVLAVFRAMFSFKMCIKASKCLHDRMTEAVLRGKISFFDTNPLGRILNRFSADVGSNDDLLPQTLFDFTVILFIVVGAICTTVVSLPFALLAIPPLFYYFIQVRKIFVSSTRELKRLEGLARSPIFAMMSESLSGVATIRANDAVGYFIRKFEASHDGHTRAFFSFIASSRWVGFRMDSLVFVLMSLVSFLAVLFNTKGWFSIDPSILGLSISMLIQLAGIFQWCIRQSAEVVNQMVSVERVLEFGDIEPEAPLELDTDKDLDNSWPNHGTLNVQDLSVRYRPTLPLALDGVTFSIESGARVGVVGRTGSGKSSLVQALFRLLEAENGTIEIDNVNIAKVGLHRLRTQISVIPQVPTLFSGCTVRENLDLFGLHDDRAIYQALKASHLEDVIADLPNGIDSLVSESGSNFSVGQRQLLCLARAILSKSRLLVLDEATASVDRRTDQMLHDSLHHSFGDATIIAVAHRLDTVIDHDYILVLGRGKVLEFGRPCDLLQRDDGPFSRMVNDTGPKTSIDLRRRAFANRSNKNNGTAASTTITSEEVK